jgi:type II secretory pathway component PulF
MRFNYQARSKNGRVRTGVVEASSKESAVTLLQRHDLYVTQLEEEEKKPLYAKDIGIGGDAGLKETVAFSRQLSIMFQSKVPLIEALATLAEQQEKPKFKEKLTKISESIEGGISFSQSLSEYPKIFDDFYVNMVKAGEASGKLSESLNYLADHLEKEYELRSKVKGAMMYPALIIVMMVGILFLMAFFVIPQLTGMLLQTGQELPIITRIIIAGTDFLRSIPGIIVTLIIFGGGAVLFQLSRSGEGKKRRDKIILKIPALNTFVKQVYVARLAENLSTLIAGGLPIAKALEISGSVIGNHVYETAISETTSGVKKGERISTGLKLYPELFPPMFTTMVLVGEKTGTLDSTLMNIVRFYKAEVERSLESLLRIIEPLLIVILGGGVGILIASILLPLYSTITAI